MHYTKFLEYVKLIIKYLLFNLNQIHIIMYNIKAHKQHFLLEKYWVDAAILISYKKIRIKEPLTLCKFEDQ